ncbi:alanine--tRNA ligase [Candidatus Micrarchaeota archaeon]|nr:alanine--tRNA ligase [Candidatus Micrarchaeota archaeon]
MLSKKSLQQQFASEYKKFYEIPLFAEQGFARQVCKLCGKGFWSTTEQPDCGDSAHRPYAFFRAKPRTETYSSFWKKFEDFWKKNGHTIVPRYPVLSRWRDDLPFTIASIVDFQRLEQGKVVFEYPANPLLVPQMCLRFPDIANIGVTGRHFSCFMMAGQHAFNAPKEGYWKEECLRYNFDFLTNVLGVPKADLIYGEDLWNMPDFSAFGPSMESFAHGLELVNSVFMQYRATPTGGFEELDTKVIDVGWGFERLLWYYNGTPTAYDSVFAKPLAFLKRQAGLHVDQDLMDRYAKISSGLDVESVVNLKQEKQKIAQSLGLSMAELEKTIAPMQAMYAIADHARSLLFALSDGALPSNAAGGYNLRVLLRRSLGFLKEYHFNVELEQVMQLHAEDLKPIFPELYENLESVFDVLAVEKRKYGTSLEKATGLARQVVAEQKPITTQKLMTLYESHGITPELLEKASAKPLEIPTDFYQKLTERHVMEKSNSTEDDPDSSALGTAGAGAKKKVTLPDGLAATKLLYYDDAQLRQTHATILHVDHTHNVVVTNQTVFYPEGGGQAADHGTMDGTEVPDVQKQGSVVLHFVKDATHFKAGQKVHLQLNWDRRESISRHHTATHIMIATARQVLGGHAWQHGSHKDEDEAHVDITHYEKPDSATIAEIEIAANKIIQEARNVTVQQMDRGVAEQKYGFRLYQGGGAIGKTIRVVIIDDYDAEACGGIHRTKTNQIGLLKITGVEQIQDSVIRLRYKAGPKALEHVQKQEQLLADACAALSVSPDQLTGAVHRLFEEWKAAKKDAEKAQEVLAESYAHKLVQDALLHKPHGGNLPPQVNKEVPYTNMKLLELVATLVSQQVDCVLWTPDGLYVAATTEASLQDAKQLLQAAGAKGGGTKRFARGKKS